MTRQRRKYRKQRKLSAAIVFLYLLCIFAIFLFWQTGIIGAGLDSGISNSPAGASGVTGASGVAGAFDSTTRSIPEIPANFVQVPVAKINDTQHLQLVNRDYSISSPVQSDRLVSAWPDIPVRANDIRLHESAFSAMRELYKASERAAGIRSLFIASGYRTTEEQRDLYENAADRSFVMPPGHSEHQLGLAADILATGSCETGGMRGSDEAAWLAENAAKYGLILRYPDHKQHITDVAYEPWHFRYVGHIHAKIMTQHDFVLEEYIEFLQHEEVYNTSFEGKDYYVLFQRPENDKIFVPEGLEMSISSTNTEGYIITMWR